MCVLRIERGGGRKKNLIQREDEVWVGEEKRTDCERKRERERERERERKREREKERENLREG